MKSTKDDDGRRAGKRRVRKPPEEPSVENAAHGRGDQPDPREQPMHITQIEDRVKTALTTVADATIDNTDEIERLVTEHREFRRKCNGEIDEAEAAGRPFEEIFALEDRAGERERVFIEEIMAIVPNTQRGMLLQLLFVNFDSREWDRWNAERSDGTLRTMDTLLLLNLRAFLEQEGDVAEPPNHH